MNDLNVWFTRPPPGTVRYSHFVRILVDVSCPLCFVAGRILVGRWAGVWSDRGRTYSSS